VLTIPTWHRTTVRVVCSATIAEINYFACDDVKDHLVAIVSTSRRRADICRRVVASRAY
jgi:hypothetical protein